MKNCRFFSRGSRVSRLCRIVVVAAVSLGAHGQSWLDYNQTLSRHSWLRTTNAAALTTYQPDDSTQRLLADAQVGLATGQGGLVPNGHSPDIWQATAMARSVFRVNRRVVLRGGIDYSNAWGRDAAGSVWIAPERMPFDITETADTTQGRTSLEQYGLTGEVGVNVWRGLSLGARFGYHAASSAKRKDPRHTGTLMQLDASVGGIWCLGRLTLGANYLLQRSTEALRFSTYGRTDRVYGYLIDYGAAFGRDERTDGKGYVSSDYEKPLLDMRHGVALQAGYAGGPWSAVVEWEWAHRHGHYGLESPSLLDLNRHRGDEWHLRSWWQHAAPHVIHRITALWSHQDLKDYERTYRIVTDGGVTQIVYYDDREMSQRQTDHVTVAYDLQWGIRRHLATWQAQAQVDYSLRTVTASLYPYYRWQQAHRTDIRLSAQRNWLLPSDHTWSLALMAGWGSGGGTPRSDGAYALTGDGDEYPQGHLDWLMRHYEWLTARRVQVGTMARWSMPLAHGRLRLYAQAHYSYVRAFDTHYLADAHRHNASLVVGCLF